MQIEIDGPASAWFEDSKGTKWIYKTYRLKSQNQAELMWAFANWKMSSGGIMIVYRSRPQISYEKDEITHDDNFKVIPNPNPSPHWRMAWRAAIVEDVPLNYYAVEIPEGGLTQVL